MTERQLFEPGDEDVAPLDIAELLDSPEAVAGFLQVAFEEGTTDEILMAIGHAAKAMGMAELAAEIGVGRQSLYKSLAPDGNPRFDTIVKVLAALGVKLTAEPIQRDAA